MNNIIKRTQADHDKVALTNYESFDQVKDIGLRSAKLSQALKGVKGCEEEYYKVFENMIHAYHIIGKELSGMGLSSGRPTTEMVSSGNHLTLTNLGITKKQSFEWQSIALVPLNIIEEYIEARHKEDEPTTKADILQIAQTYKSAEDVCREEIQRVTITMTDFCVKARRLNDHLREFPDSRKVAPKAFFELLTTFKEYTDKLERSIL